MQALHEIWERYQRMVKEYPNNDITDKMLLLTIYRGLNTTSQSYLNQFAEANIMNKTSRG